MVAGLEASAQNGPLILMLVLGGGLLLLTIAIFLSAPRKSVPLPPDASGHATGPTIAPTDFMTHIREGNSLLSSGEYDQALAHFEAAGKLRPREPSIHFKMGRIFLQKEDYKNATAAFNNTLNLNPEQIEAHYELARIAQILKKPEQAHRILDQALEINPEHEVCLKLKLKLFEEVEKYDAAFSLARQLSQVAREPTKYRALAAEYALKLDLADEAIAEYESLLVDDPDNAALYQEKIGQAYFEQEDYVNAVEAFKTALQPVNGVAPTPENTEAIQSQMAASLCNRGVKHFEAGTYAEAIQCYQEALHYDDDNADIHYNLGKACVGTGDAEAALKHFRRAIELNPRDIASYYEIAVLQDEQGNTDEAIAGYEELLALDPRHVQGHFELGTLYGMQDQLDPCIRHLTAAIKLNPGFVEALYNLGVALEQKQDFKQAIQTYQRVLQLEPGHEKAKSNLAHIRHARKK
jgi:tetratricopeptide (TPR) repeat protein